MVNGDASTSASTARRIAPKADSAITASPGSAGSTFGFAGFRQSSGASAIFPGRARNSRSQSGPFTYSLVVSTIK